MRLNPCKFPSEPGASRMDNRASHVALGDESVSGLRKPSFIVPRGSPRRNTGGGDKINNRNQTDPAQSLDAEPAGGAYLMHPAPSAFGEIAGMHRRCFPSPRSPGRRGCSTSKAVDRAHSALAWIPSTGPKLFPMRQHGTLPAVRPQTRASMDARER